MSRRQANGRSEDRVYVFGLFSQVPQSAENQLGARPGQPVTWKYQIPFGLAPMRDLNDAWFVRMPDGRVVRAKTTASVRRHVESGNIPVDSWVRRSPEDDWVTLEWAVEFTDLVALKQKKAAEQSNGRDALTAPAARSSDPRSGHDLQAVGVRGLVEELMTALDSTMSRRKLAVAAAGGVLGGGVVIGRQLLEPFALDDAGLPLSWLIVAAALFLIGGVCTTLLTQMTFVELSRLRPARWHEATTRLGLFSSRLILSHVLVGGGVLLAIFGIYALGEWVLVQDVEGPGPTTLAAAANMLTLILEVLLWPTLGLTFLLSPIVIVEECSAFRAIAQWWTLLRRYLSRAFFYEALAAALGTIMTLPFLVPVIVAGWFSLRSPHFPDVTMDTLCVLTGLALTPLIAYMAVANVFIYLNLRYELSPSQRE